MFERIEEFNDRTDEMRNSRDLSSGRW